MTMLESRLPDFPANPEDGFEIKEPLPDGGHVIWKYAALHNEWTYEVYNNALQGYIYTDQVRTRVEETVRSDEPELLTQKDVNHYLDAKESAGGGGGSGVPGKETLPWLQINKWGMRKNPFTGNPIYEVSWSNNPNCTYTWQYEIDGEGDGNWIDIADHPQKEALGYTPGGEFPIQLSLSGTGQADILPNALMRFRITGELNGLLSELSSGVIAAWEERMDEYEPPLYETGIAADLEPYATTEYVDEKVEEYLPLKGGTLGGALSCTRPGSTAAGTYLFSVKAEGLEDGKQVAFRVTADGAVKAGHDTGHPFMAKAKNDVVTKQYLDQQIAAIPAPEIPEVGGGVVFTEKYNGNRYYKQGLDTTGLEDGEVMFCSNGASTTMFAAITHVCLPEAGIDWTKFTKIGTIEVRNGATHCGHLQVISAMNNPGRNWKVKVKVLDVENNELAPESGHPCYFWGMFTG